MQRFLAGRIIGIAASLAVVAGISFFYRHILHVNQTTVALSFLLAILAVSAVWGMAVSVAMSLLAVVAFNYFFLPPAGTLTIARSDMATETAIPHTAETARIASRNERATVVWFTCRMCR